MVLLGVSWALARRGLALRMPTDGELEDITEPLGRVAVRHLPMELLSPDIRDSTSSARALYGYLRREDEPLIGRRDYAPAHGLEELS